MDKADASDSGISGTVTDGVSGAAEAVRAMPEGKPGECSWCGEFSPRLVGGACARCRDKYGLK